MNSRGVASRAGLPAPRSLVTADDVQQGKPSPEAYLRAASELAVDAGRCVVIEDSGTESGGGLSLGGWPWVKCATTSLPILVDATAGVGATYAPPARLADGAGTRAAARRPR